MTAATEVKFSEYAGKKVTLQRDTGAEVEDIKGTVEAVNQFAVLFKPKGKANSVMIEPDEIVGIELDEAAAAKSTGGGFKLKQRRVAPVTESNVRRHLLDGHGVTLSYVNQVTAAQALAAHTDLHDRENADDIGHYHAEKGQAE